MQATTYQLHGGGGATMRDNSDNASATLPHPAPHHPTRFGFNGYTTTTVTAPAASTTTLMLSPTTATANNCFIESYLGEVLELMYRTVGARMRA